MTNDTADTMGLWKRKSAAKFFGVLALGLALSTITGCSDVEVRKDGAYRKEKDARASLSTISSARADNHVKICDVVFRIDGPSSVPITMHGNGYTCKEWVGGNDTCECAELP